MTIASINPATGKLLKTFSPITDEQVIQKISAAHHAFLTYRKTDFSARSRWLLRLADLLHERAADYGSLITLEMGKPLTFAMGEVEKCALVCRFYAEQGEAFLQDVSIATEAVNSYVTYQPQGIILAVMPWNFPFWQVFRFAAPALMAGNVGLLKGASNVPQCSLAIEAVIRDAGFPADVFQSLLITPSQIEAIVADDRIRAATLTGSEGAGASLAANAGKNLKKVVLELGGSDPFVVMPSADLDAAVHAGVLSRMRNSGQICISAKRFILHEAIAAAFIRKMTAKVNALRVGDPMDKTTDLGPLATSQILHEIDRQVKHCIEEGATLITGGFVIDQPGNFYAPTLLSDFPVDSIARQEEFFGPVGLLFTVKSLAEAIALANSTSFGLGASAWTRETQEIDRLTAGLDAGCVFINSMVQSDPRLPFGGTKRSGWGRELGREGMLEFMNPKTVWVS
jgi:succinate-semialdehyde dehydrogenase / glutarate-semialdehyde dehydrogenase